ncbi:MAG TPA: ATP-binding protein [Rhodoblastus sp.]|nr:ATP-binding protein [Rhodoblastus sp.]
MTLPKSNMTAARAAPRRVVNAVAQKIWRGLFLAQDCPEQGIMLNRLLLAVLVLAAAMLNARRGGEALRFLAEGLPGLQAYIAFIGLAQAHLALWPERGRLRKTLSICADAAFISYGLYLGSGASAFLFPLYLWMILGNGLRLGASYMAVSVASAALGFAATVVFTPFWQANAPLTAGLFFALITMPAYGALLLRRLKEARAEAERANHAKTLLLANVSHELRTPLTAILGLGEMLKKTGLDGRQREMVQTICGAGGVLLRHIEALLAIARDEIGAEDRRAERVDLYALLLSLRAMLAVEAGEKGVRLGLSIDAGTPRHVRVEPGLLLDVLQNLGGNAVKFTADGAVAIHVAAREVEGGHLLRVEARDTGIGVDKAAQDRIFEAFVQAGPDIAARFGGSGLGLAIARRRIEARGGRIGVDSEPGRGATFWFELFVERDATPAPARAMASLAPPLRFEAGDGRQALGPVCVLAPAPFDSLALARRFAIAAVARRETSEEIFAAQQIAADLRDLSGGLADSPRDEIVAEKLAPRGDGRRILLAEDNGVNRMIFEAILSGAGFRVTSVADGGAALDAMLNQSFDLILLDLNMPKIDGAEAARLYQAARAGEPCAPIVALTADATAERREECAEAGIAACLVKPIAPEALLMALDAVLADDDEIAPEPTEQVSAASVAALATLGGEEFATRVIAEFVAESAQIAERMAAAVERKDLHAFRREAHALESSAGNVGALALARLCRAWRNSAPEAFALHDGDYLDLLRRELLKSTVALNDSLAARACAAA